MKKSRYCGKSLLVGDNPFHNISHLSQERIRKRNGLAANPEFAAGLISIAARNGANGFMFSVSETTLGILNIVRERGDIDRLRLYAIVPYAYEYVKLATQLGGVPGLAKRLSKQVLLSGNVKAIAYGLNSVVYMSPVSLMKTYLTYEISRIRSAAGKKARIEAIILHEVLVDMALALNLSWFFKEYRNFVLQLGVTPGFNTCNFAFLVNKFNEWRIDLRGTVIAAPFNKVGFQMNPSKKDCEEALKNAPGPVLVAISILAAGYLKPSEAIDYIANLPNLAGVAAGVSKEKQAHDTFAILSEKLFKPQYAPALRT